MNSDSMLNAFGFISQSLLFFVPIAFAEVLLSPARGWETTTTGWDRRGISPPSSAKDSPEK
ncbi:MAG: hypothetical protein LKE41_13530 [Prevotella sp.]|nr:hypothetical protein [Prevotella sp.]MCI2102344.1 hypothetical protein [Prevotella sp.]